MSGRKGYTFQQDRTRFHTGENELVYLEATFHKLLPPNYWPPSCPDINPPGLWYLVYAKNNVYSVKIQNMIHLKRRIRKCWKEIPQETVDKTIYRFCTRVQKLIAVEGRRFEYLLK